MITRLLFIQVVLATTSFVAAADVHAVCLNPENHDEYLHPTVEQEFESSDAIVVGIVVEVRNLSENPNDPGGWTAYSYKVRATQVIHGTVSEEFVVRAENDSGGYRGVDAGSIHLLFLKKRDENYSVDPCGNSGELSDTSAVLNELRALLGNSADAA